MEYETTQDAAVTRDEIEELRAENAHLRERVEFWREACARFRQAHDGAVEDRDMLEELFS